MSFFLYQHPDGRILCKTNSSTSYVRLKDLSEGDINSRWEPVIALNRKGAEMWLAFAKSWNAPPVEDIEQVTVIKYIPVNV